jgi:hypothetical protein
VKFVHLVQENDPKNFRPYDLIVINPTESYQGEHFTMSAAGIVHITPHSPSECIPLSTWLRQSMMFNILRNIPFYKYYLHRKAFTIWKDNVRFLLYTKQRKRISEKYFLTRKTSCSPIIEIKKYLLEIQHVSLIQNEIRCVDKNNYLDQQNTSFQTAFVHFEDNIRKIINEVQNVIIEVTSLYNTVQQEDDNGGGMGLGGTGGGMIYNDGSSPEKAKSLVKIQEEKLERKQTKLRAIYEYNTLPEFIRMIDYMTVETLASITIKAVRKFYEELTKVRKGGIFETTIQFTSSQTLFNPTCGEIKELMEKLFELLVTTVSNVNRVSYLNTTHHSNKQHSSGPNIQSIIKENRQFQHVSKQIQLIISSDFDKAQDHVGTLDSVRPIYKFNQDWNFEVYKAEHQELSSLKTTLEQIINWNKELDKLRNKTIGVLEVDSKKLKGELSPMREARLAEIKDYMKDIAS